MNKKSLSTLEFYKIIDELTDMADSVYGKAHLQRTFTYDGFSGY